MLGLLIIAKSVLQTEALGSVFHCPVEYIALSASQDHYLCSELLR